MAETLSELPPELMELIARAAGRGDAKATAALLATSGALRLAMLKAVGAETIFKALALASIEALPDIVARILFVERVIRAGLRAEVFVWPPCEPPSGPLPSPLREHVCQWGGPPGYSLPLEHNLMVGLGKPLDPEARSSGFLMNVGMFNMMNNWTPGTPLQTVHLDFPGGQLVLGGATATASNVRHYNGEHYHNSLQCCRRMQIVLRK